MPRAAPRLPPPTIAILPLSVFMGAVCGWKPDIPCQVSRIIYNYAGGPAAFDRAFAAGEPSTDGGRTRGAAGGLGADDPAGHGRVERGGNPGDRRPRGVGRVAAAGRLSDEADGTV